MGWKILIAFTFALSNMISFAQADDFLTNVPPQLRQLPVDERPQFDIGVRKFTSAGSEAGFHVERWSFSCLSNNTDCALERARVECIWGALMATTNNHRISNGELIIERFDPLNNILSFRFPERLLSDEWVNATVTLQDRREPVDVKASVTNLVHAGKTETFQFRSVPQRLKAKVPCEIDWGGLWQRRISAK